MRHAREAGVSGHRGDVQRPGEAADVADVGLDDVDRPAVDDLAPAREQAVLLAAGDVEKLRHAADRAERDWRDVLVWSGLGDGDWDARLDVELGAS